MKRLIKETGKALITGSVAVGLTAAWWVALQEEPGLDGGASPLGGQSAVGDDLDNYPATGGGSTFPSLPDMPDLIPEAEAEEKDGSRIVNRYLTTAGGFKRSSGIYDTHLGVDVGVFLASDGTNRFMPTVFTSYSAEYYSDAACTQRIMNYSGCEEPEFLSEIPSPSAECSEKFYRTFRVTGKNHASGYHKKNDGTCEETIIGANNFYTVTEMSPSEFVQVL